MRKFLIIRHLKSSYEDFLKPTRETSELCTSECVFNEAEFFEWINTRVGTSKIVACYSFVILDNSISIHGKTPSEILRIHSGRF